MPEPLKVPKNYSDYLARPGRRSRNGVAFKYRGDEVTRLQEALKALGYRVRNFRAEKGRFGAGTDAAVRRFQRSHKDLSVPKRERPHLQPDGIVGPKTAAALNCALARAGKGLEEFKFKWVGEEGSHFIKCTAGSKISITPSEERDVRWHIGWKPISFLAIDGTASPDADGFADEMNKLRSTKGRNGGRVPVFTQNTAQVLNVGEGAQHPLSTYVQRPRKGTGALAINLQKEKKEEVITESSAAYSHARNLLWKAGILLKESVFRPDIFYCAMHASLTGGISFIPDQRKARRHVPGSSIVLFKPSIHDKKIDWGTVKWMILASCGSLSLHYRYFGIPGHARTDSREWAHEHRLARSAAYLDHRKPWMKKYVLSHYYPGLEWLRIIKTRAPKLHGLLGYWDKSPGGDVGSAPDKAIALEFVKRLKDGETILKAWAQPGGRQTKAWASIVDEKYKDETLEDLITNRLRNPEKRKWMYASLHTGDKDKRKRGPIPIKEAFIEANMMKNYTDDARQGKKRLGNFRVHRDYGWTLKRKRFYPGDLMTKRKVVESKKDKSRVKTEKEKQMLEREKGKLGNVEYPRGDIIESFAFRGKHFSALSIPQMKNLLAQAIGELSVGQLKKTYRPIKVLLSGFKPWKDAKHNPSQVVAQEMDGRIMEVDTAVGQTLVYVSGIVLPVWWYDAADWLIEEIKLGYPDIVIGFGLKGDDDPRVEIETYTYNENVRPSKEEKEEKKWNPAWDGRKFTPEKAIQNRPSWLNDLHKTTDPTKVRADGPPKLPLDLTSAINIPHNQIEKALNSAKGALSSFIDRPGGPSENGLMLHVFAGTTGDYVCNQIFYNLMYHNLRPPPLMRSQAVETRRREESRRAKPQSFNIGDRSFKYDVMTGFIHLPKSRAREKLKKTAEITVEACVKEYVDRVKEYVDKGDRVDRKMLSLNKPILRESYISYRRGDLFDTFDEWYLDAWP